MLLMLFIQYGILARSLPKVGYIKGTDLWLVGCIIVIMIPIMESTVVGYLFRINGGIKGNIKVGRSEISLLKFVDVMDTVCKYLLIVLALIATVVYFVVNASD